MKEEIITQTGTGYSNASVLNKVTFSWVNELLKKGFVKPLEASDVPPLTKVKREIKQKVDEQKCPKGVMKVKEEFIHQHFLLQVESNTISIEECEKYISSHRTALSATDAMGNTAIRFATMNRNLKLFLLLTKSTSGKRRDGA